MGAERFFSGVECRAECRRLTGPALVFGDVSLTHRERFEDSAFDADLAIHRTRWLDVEHDVSRVIAHTGSGGMDVVLGRYEIRCAPAVIVTAELPEIRRRTLPWSESAMGA